jgi:hypothetical protein
MHFPKAETISNQIYTRVDAAVAEIRDTVPPGLSHPAFRALLAAAYRLNQLKRDSRQRPGGTAWNGAQGSGDSAPRSLRRASLQVAKYSGLTGRCCAVAIDEFDREWRLLPAQPAQASRLVVLEHE